MNLADLVGELHTELAQALLRKIRSGEYTAADLGVARQFLKDNGIDDAGISKSSPIRRLDEAMPFADDDGLPITKAEAQ